MTVEIKHEDFSTNVALMEECSLKISTSYNSRISCTSALKQGDFALVFHKRLSVSFHLVDQCLVENLNTNFLKTIP